MPYERPLWEYRLLEDFTEDTSILFIRMHHSFTDGIGYVSLMSCINDEKYKTTSKKKIPKYNIFMNALIFILSPFLILYNLPKIRSFQTDQKAAFVREIKGQETYKNKYYASDYIPFEDVKKCYKKFEKTTFNDYVLGVISKSFDLWYKQNGVEGADRIVTMLPISIRELPKSIEELNLDNQTVGFKFPLPIRDKIETAIKEVKPYLRRFLHPLYVAAMTNFAGIAPYLPETIGRLVFQDYYSQADMLFSNVPFAEEPWYFCNKEVIRFGVFANAQHSITFNLVALTYRGQLRFTIMSKENLKMNPQQLLDNIMSNIV